MGDAAELKRSAEKASEAKLKCYAEHWELCVAGVAAGMPVSMYTRKYWPFFVGGVLGTVLDFTKAHHNCRALAEEADAADGRLRASQGKPGAR